MPLIKKLALPAGAALAALLAAGAPAVAGNGHGATRFASCPAETWSGVVGAYEFEFCFSDVVTPKGKAIARFDGHLMPWIPAPQDTVTINGFPCQAAFPSREITTNTRLVVTPEGRVSGTCKG